MLDPTRIQNARPTHGHPLQRHNMHKSDRPHQPNNALAASERSFPPSPPPCLGRSAEREVPPRTGQRRIHWGTVTEIPLHRNHHRPSPTMYRMLGSTARQLYSVIILFFYCAYTPLCAERSGLQSRPPPLHKGSQCPHKMEAGQNPKNQKMAPRAPLRMCLGAQPPIQV